MAKEFSSGRVASLSARRKRALSAAIAALDPLEARLLLSTTPSFLPTFHRFAPQLTANASPALSAVEVLPAQMRHAYGIDAITVNGVVGDGSGQTIAIIDAFRDPTLAADLATFDSLYGLAAPTNLIQIRQDGSLITSSNQPPVDNVDPAGNSWAVETSLDVEWAHVIAPKANILVVLSDDNGNGLYTAVTTGATYTGTPGVARASAVSMSWGGNELGGTIDSLFNVAGTTFVASSGDSGGYNSGGASYPASSPNVLSVGGTTLFLSGGNYASESAWSGSGGGLSKVEAEPAYQKAVVPSSFTTTVRAIPDVSMDASPNSGVPVIDSYDLGSSSPIQVGGTSLAAPMWAALIGITNQERVAAGKPTLNQTLSGPTGTLPLLYSVSSSDFNDITTGTNGNTSNDAAKVGYDLVTGRGTPIANKLVPDLVGPVGTPNPTITSLTVSPSSTTIGTNVTLTANNVTDPGAAISGVAFYLESNATAGVQPGSDTLVGAGTASGSNWSLTISTSAMAAGAYTYYAVATDSASVSSPTGTSAPSAGLTLTVPVPNPTIGSFAANPASIIAGTASTTLTASNVTDAGSAVTAVNFYRESNATAGLQIGTDTLIGAGTQNGSSWSIATSTASLAVGNYTYYAVATDAASVSSLVASASLTVSANTQPLIFSRYVNIGSPNPLGTASFNSTTGVYTITGGGTDIAGTSDQFNLAFANYSGTVGSIVAQVTSLTNTSSGAKAGVMFRNANSATSMFVDLVVTPGQGISFQYRLHTGGGTTTVATIPAIAAPVWLKITRNVYTFTAFYSTSATPPTSWTQIGSAVTVYLNSPGLAGLAVTSQNNGVLATATFATGQLGTSTLVKSASVGVTPAITLSAPPTQHDAFEHAAARLSAEISLGSSLNTSDVPPLPCPAPADSDAGTSATPESSDAPGDLDAILANRFQSQVIQLHH